MSNAELEPATVRLTMKERQRQLREDAILDSAVELIQQKGFNAMTLEDITDAIGISRPTLYQHFNSKEDILIHVAMRNLRSTQRRLKEMDPSRSATDRLGEFINWSIERKFGAARETFYDMTRLVLTCGSSDPRLIGPQSSFMRDLEELIEAAQKERGVRSDISAMIVAEIFVGAIKSITFNRLVQEGRTTAEEISSSLSKLLFSCPESGSGKSGVSDTR